MKPRKDLIPPADSIDWEGGPKNISVISGRKDVALTVNAAGHKSNGEQRYCRVIRFYGDVEKKICGDDMYMNVGIDRKNNRVYFDRATSRTGYKITKSNSKAKSTAKMIRSTQDDILFWWNIEGDYNLLFDWNLELYFIDFSKVKEGKA